MKEGGDHEEGEVIKKNGNMKMGSENGGVAWAAPGPADRKDRRQSHDKLEPGKAPKGEIRTRGEENRA
jgi:hypothetical protein